MEQQQQQYNPVVFSTNFRSGGRTYFLNMLESKKNTKYIKITESKATESGDYEKHMIMLFENGMVRLSKALNQAIIEMARPGDEQKEKKQQKENSAEEDLYANSGKKWTPEDEQKLCDLFTQGRSVEELTAVFGRRPGGIEARLQKLELVEA